MPRAGLSRAEVVRLALEVVDGGGPSGFDQLSLAAVAAAAGVATPSLYKHIGSLAALRREVSIVAVGEITVAGAAATIGLSGPDALRALAHAIRDYAHAHPGRYAAVQVAPDPEHPDDAELRTVGGRAVEVFARALRGFALPLDQVVDAVRAARAAIHGFVDLELGGGYRLADDLDRSFETLLDLVVAGLAHVSRPVSQEAS